MLIIIPQDLSLMCLINYPLICNNSIIPYKQRILSSSIGGKFWKKDVKNIFELTYLLESVLVGILLSDAWIIRGQSLTANNIIAIKLIFPKSFELLWNLFTILSPIMLSMPKLILGLRSGTITKSLQLFTMALPAITILTRQFLDVNNKKIIPLNIYDLLNPISLAYWIMCDGESQISGLRLCTDSFSILEVVTLMNVLNIKFNIHTRIHWKKNSNNKKMPRIYIPASEMDKLRLIVKDHILPNFLYKINKKENKYYKKIQK